MFKNWINNHFGSKKGLLNIVKYKISFFFQNYRKYEQIDFNRVKKLVFICSGNICRSSLAEYVARSLNVPTESFGLHCRGGDQADPRAIDFANRTEIDMSEHVTRNIKEYVDHEDSLLVVMEPSHLLEIENLSLNKCQITSLPIWMKNRNVYLHDPFSCNIDFFERCERSVYLSSYYLARKVFANDK